MIQRIQSIYLLVGAVAMAIFCILPFGAVGADEQLSHVACADYPVYLILNILIAVVLFLAIFLFKNRKMQLTLTRVSLLLIAVSAVCGGLLLFGGDSEGARLEWAGGVTLLIIALFMTLMAGKGIRHDINIIKNADRL